MCAFPAHLKKTYLLKREKKSFFKKLRNRTEAASASVLVSAASICIYKDLAPPTYDLRMSGYIVKYS